MLLFIITNLVAYNASHCRTTNCSESTPVRKDSTSDGTSASADRGISIPGRHTGTTDQPGHLYYGQNDYKSSHPFD